MKRTQPRNRKPRVERAAPPDLSGDLMTPIQVAQYFGVRMRRVHYWERRRFLTPVRTARGERVYMTMEVEHLAGMHGR